ncbi:MAG TPA: protease modulator HflC, partial [Gammaproteobacteria bacterium]|nr:protease modulator HflC [Gammaproteobacteria bacterium]
KWRIHDVVTYYKAMSGEERKAMERIYATINDGLRSEFGKRSIQEVISGERSEIMNTMTNEANRQLGKFGVEVVDVRVKRIDFSDDISDSVYRRMEAERLRVAKDFRSRGAEEAEKIRAKADKERTVLLADAYKQAQTIRGEGDAKAAEIYAKAYKQDPEFFAFYRSLQAYRKSLGGEADTLVLEPDSEFFRYFGSQKAGRK